MFATDVLAQMKNDTCKNKYKIVGNSKILEKS